LALANDVSFVAHNRSSTDQMNAKPLQNVDETPLKDRIAHSREKLVCARK